jgi:hypothetical protein
MSVFAAFDIRLGKTDDTFTQQTFLNTFKAKILPYLNAWPHPKSIVILDNAKIHMYKEFQVLTYGTCALLFFLPSYSPDLNPIEVGFSLLKRWIQRNANMAFRENPLAVLDVDIYFCTRQKYKFGDNLYGHCGYQVNKPSINNESTAQV